MQDDACALLDTAIGRCAIAWNARGVTAFQLPEPTDLGTLRRMRRGRPPLEEATPPAEVQDAIDRIARLMDGERIDLRGVRLDMSGTPAFHRRVYEVSREILAGHTRTYGEVAALIGEPHASRAVGQALGANPFAIIVPCHRVLAAGGRSGGFSAGGGVDTKLKILLIERAQFGTEPGLF
jgi:methylated-DNA-[protein]-cysteine S-methyltransferase